MGNDLHSSFEIARHVVQFQNEGKLDEEAKKQAEDDLTPRKSDQFI